MSFRLTKECRLNNRRNWGSTSIEHGWPAKRPMHHQRIDQEARYRTMGLTRLRHPSVIARGEQTMTLCDYWVSNENPRLLPVIASRTRVATTTGQFLLSVNGSPVAWTDPHGTTLEWIIC